LFVDHELILRNIYYIVTKMLNQ